MEKVNYAAKIRIQTSKRLSRPLGFYSAKFVEKAELIELKVSVANE